MADRFVVLDIATGRPQAEAIQSYLRAHGFQCELAQEAAGWVEGLIVGPLGEVQILVPSRQSKEARKVLERFTGVNRTKAG